MTTLLDTHALLWWLAGDAHLSGVAREIIGSPESTILVSAVSGWEITTKYRIGKLPSAGRLALNFAASLTDQGFQPLPIALEHAVRAGLLPGPHKDPFDRMLIAQALTLNVPLISNEVVFDGYGVHRIW